MYIGEVLGTVKCSLNVPALNGSYLKAVRIYRQGRSTSIVIASGSQDPENGEFVYLVSGCEAAKVFGFKPGKVDYAILGKVNEVLGMPGTICNL